MVVPELPPTPVWRPLFWSKVESHVMLGDVGEKYVIKNASKTKTKRGVILNGKGLNGDCLLEDYLLNCRMVFLVFREYGALQYIALNVDKLMIWIIHFVSHAVLVSPR